MITMVYNEKAFLPIWASYYGRHFGTENLFVIDDASTDGSTEGLGAARIIRIEREPIDQDLRAVRMSLFHEALLAYYDAVIFTDVDEFLVVDPLLNMGLADYVMRHAPKHANAIGFNVLHNVGEEPPYRLDEPLFAQRSYLQFERGYCKQLIHKSPVRWHQGFHGSTKPFALAVGLYLFHLRAVDYDISASRITNRNQLPWAEVSLKRGHGIQNRLPQEEYLEMYFPSVPERFSSALSEKMFNEYVMLIAQELAKEAQGTNFDYDPLRRQLSRVPARFRNAINPANEFYSDASRASAGVAPRRDIPADELLKRATAAAILMLEEINRQA